MRTITGYDELRTIEGEFLGWSDWHEVTQERVDRFTLATGDAGHAYLTLSLAPVLLGEITVTEGVRMGVNYGLNSCRFPAPVPVGARVRMGATVLRVEDVGNDGAQVTYELTFEVD